MKCACGNDRFMGQQLCRMGVIVDEHNMFVSNPERHTADGSTEEYFDIYDCETPYGPYECTACGREYETLSE